ncbi:MAG: hypothetical protein M3Y87_14595 [Myxococcota bacterium]|nr:hypothetical protein [Myxococcota bacterium]
MQWWSTDTLEPVGEPFPLFAGRAFAIRSDCTLYASEAGNVFVVSTSGLEHWVPGRAFVSMLDDDGMLTHDETEFQVVDAAGSVTRSCPRPSGIGDAIGAGGLLGPNGVYYLATETSLGGGQGVAAIYVGVRPGPRMDTQSWAHTNTPLAP